MVVTHDRATDITSAVVNGSYRTPKVAAGEWIIITLKVTVKSGAAAGFRLARKIIIRSAADQLKVDAVKAVIRRA